MSIQQNKAIGNTVPNHDDVSMDESQAYVAVKIVRAIESYRNDELGYTVFYNSGYKSWCPKEEFEKYNLAIGDYDKIKECLETEQTTRKSKWNVELKPLNKRKSLKAVPDFFIQLLSWGFKGLK